MSTKATEPPSPDDHDKVRRELLLKVDDAAISEYRFNVQLGWDRNKFFIGLSVTMIGAGVGLMRLAEGNTAISIFLFLFFLLLVAITVSGWRATEKSKRYSRQAVLTKTLIERELGLWRQLPDLNDPELHLAIAVTPGQRKFREVIFRHKKREQKKPDPGSALRAFSAQS